MPDLEFTLNGQPRRVSPRAGESLLETLRTRCDVTSTKDGCQPQGQCGCCLALVDGLPKVSCAVPAERVAGKSVLTLEGLPDDERRLIARSFVAVAGLQCGFCIPGIALQAHRLLEKRPDASRDDIARALAGHLCRCTGYTKILDAVELLGRAKRGEAAPRPCESGRVGDPLARFEGEEFTLGDHAYIDDLSLPDMLHGALVLSPHARARVVGIDVSRAAAHPGVEAVVTADDVPGDRWVGLIYADWPGFVAVGEEVSCVGDVLAGEAAVDEATAREAVALVEVEYEVLEPVLDPETAAAPGAPRVNPRHENVLSETLVRRGDAGAAL